MTTRRYRAISAVPPGSSRPLLVAAAAIVVPSFAAGAGSGSPSVDDALAARLRELGYTGRVESTL